MNRRLHANRARVVLCSAWLYFSLSNHPKRRIGSLCGVGGASKTTTQTNMNPTIQILTEATHEIHRLRRQNEILNAKVEVMELFACVLHTSPAQHGNCMAVDIAWQMEKEAERLKAEQGPEIPFCPDCHSKVLVTLSPPESASRGKWFCPCNEPSTKPSGSGHFDA
jgi:hypothetical protein